MLAQITTCPGETPAEGAGKKEHKMKQYLISPEKKQYRANLHCHSV